MGIPVRSRELEGGVMIQPSIILCVCHCRHLGVGSYIAVLLALTLWPRWGSGVGGMQVVR